MRHVVPLKTLDEYPVQQTLLLNARAHTFGHIVTEKHELARAFGQEKYELAELSSFGRFKRKLTLFH
jgi:hypothetical protein